MNDDASEPPAKPPAAAPIPEAVSRGRSRSRMIWFVLPILCLLVAAAFFAGYLPKRRIREELNVAAAIPSCSMVSSFKSLITLT